MSRALSLAGFQVTIIGRFWVTAEALFAKEGRVFSVGTVAMKIHNPKLARELWKEDEDGDTWEYMYFLEDVGRVDVPYEKFNIAAGYKVNNVIRGFNVLPEEK